MSKWPTCGGGLSQVVLLFKAFTNMVNFTINNLILKLMI